MAQISNGANYLMSNKIQLPSKSLNTVSFVDKTYTYIRDKIHVPEVLGLLNAFICELLHDIKKLSKAKKEMAGRRKQLKY